jgi:hypothetical protein
MYGTALKSQNFSGESGAVLWDMSISKNDSSHVFLLVSVKNISIDTIFFSETSSNYIDIDGNRTWVSIGWNTDNPEKNLIMKPLAPNAFFHFSKVIPKYAACSISMTCSYMPKSCKTIIYGQKHLIEGTFESFEIKLLPEMIDLLR